ncbi:hypothetical protein B6U99_04720 [Candidatus Geothermarchaeota archaeon ex4572_27]|nr:MAG: hypothetical protein B6U99_04720 [Candidatus Geothermarchaeota archaeon ex4572_27]
MSAIRVEEVPGLPPRAKEYLKSRGIEELYPPQVEAIERGLLEGENLVVAVPTAAGKTLIALMAMMKRVMSEGGKALYLVPLRALASEKYEEFQGLEELGLKVALSTGDYDSSDPWLSRYDVIVATNEKADSLMRHRASWLDEVSIVVADEVHLLGDPTRGPTLEVVLAKVRRASPGAQLIALSATIRNAEEISRWLSAKLVASSWRPVPLRMGVYYDGRVLFDDGSIVPLPAPRGVDPVTALAVDVACRGGQALVFTNTRQASLSYAERAKAHVERLLGPEDRRELRELADEVLSEGEANRVSQRLAECIRGGVAFHHAGLSAEHRRIVERAFRGFKLKVVCATPTLAAGVNLPARRVVLQDYRRYEPGLGYSPIPTLEFHQMAGRAGRPQFDERGEAILVARRRSEVEMLFESYVAAPPERIWSKLATEPALRSHILAFIASGSVVSEEELSSFIGATLYAHQYGAHTAYPAVRRVLGFLEREGFIARVGGGFMATSLGHRTAQLYIDPLSAVILRDGLRGYEARTPLGYLFIICSTPDVPRMYLRRGERERLSGEVERRLEELPRRPPSPIEDPYGYEDYLSTLKTAMILYEWIEEAPEDEIVEEYGVGPGDIHALAQTAKWLAYSARELCRVLGYASHVDPLNVLEQRLREGCREELLPLTALQGVGRVRARMLFNAGYRSLEDLSRATLRDLVEVPGIGPETARSILRQLGRLREP